jgi:N-acetyltransferase
METRLVTVILADNTISLRPLRTEDHEGLCAVGLDERIWRLTMGRVRTAEEMRAWIATALTWQAEGTALPFVIVERSSDRIIGGTRLAQFDAVNRRVEIGWTWIAPPWQRTAVNTEAKYLLLRHAFETLNCLRVQLKANALNAPSRRAILRIGATEEGTLRSFQLSPDGVPLDATHFSILASEWPAVKARLEGWLSPT